MTSRTEFLGVDFDTPSAADVETWLAGRNAASPFAYVVTPNVDHIVRFAKEDEAVRRIYAEADLCVCDSRILQRLARLAGVSLSIVPGSDLVAGLFGRLLQSGDTICLIGGSAETAGQLQARFPDIRIAHHEPPMGLRHDEGARAAAIAFAIGCKARVTLLAVGSPQQELIAWEMAQHADSRGTALCIGASVEFLTGEQSRAPRIVQRAGMEWAWRLGSDPRRLARRYLVVGPAIFPMVWRWSRARQRRAS